MSVMIVTSLGDIVVDLFTNRCPLTCKNFLKLCNNLSPVYEPGISHCAFPLHGFYVIPKTEPMYYNGCLFHTVQKDFTAQTGDPTGTGSGGDSIYKFLYGDQARFFGDEIHLDVKHSKTGTVAMASAGENLNASQFYMTLRGDLDYLDGKHTVFGEVAEGLETLARINEAYVDEKSRPYRNIRIKHTYILDDPSDDPPQLSELIPDASPEGKPKDEDYVEEGDSNQLIRDLMSGLYSGLVDDDVRLEDDWVPMDEQLNPQELEEVLRAKDAHSRAVVLLIGDIPDAEIKPPDNVLFVCKLNPVTEDGDLETIFSRFGVVTSAEVIRDHKTGDSLCYAFIEDYIENIQQACMTKFEDKEACEQAYFKMDNALIDDRRIHVDFSQSVAKLWSQYKRKGQMGQAGGCFKCGSLDHIAKDCTGDSTSNQLPSKYALKADNTQRGGDRSTRYEMVFEEYDNRGPRRTRYHKAEHDEKRNMRDEKRRGTPEWHRHRESSPYRRGKEYSRENGSGDGRKWDVRDNRDERDHKRRRGNDVGRKHREGENEMRDNSESEDVRGSRRDRRDIGDDRYGHRRRGEERYSDRRSSKGDR
ncbi:cytochrome P450 monooxygenase 59 [Orobanche gracilis]